MSWWTYVTRTSGTESPKAMATKTGIDGPNFSKWKAGQIPGPQVVAAFARAYDVPVLEAFVAAGFLTAEEARQRPAAQPSWDGIPDAELVRIISRRLLEGRGSSGTPIAAEGPPRKRLKAARTTGRAPAEERQAEIQRGVREGIEEFERDHPAADPGEQGTA